MIVGFRTVGVGVGVVGVEFVVDPLEPHPEIAVARTATANVNGTRVMRTSEYASTTSEMRTVDPELIALTHDTCHV